MLIAPGTYGFGGVQWGRSSCPPREVRGGPTLLEPVNSHNWEGLGATAESRHHPCARLPALPLPLMPQNPKAAQRVPRQALGTRPCPCLLRVKAGRSSPQRASLATVWGRHRHWPPQLPVQWLLLFMESPGCSTEGNISALWKGGM